MSDHPADARLERKAIYAKRHAFQAESGVFVRTMREAMTSYAQARAAGMSREDAITGLEHVIRDTWPKPSTKYPPQCATCDDLGYEELVCWRVARCQREKCQQKGDEWQHRYVQPCQCVKGDKFRAKAYQDEQVASVGKVRKPRGFSRMGQ